MNDYVCSQIIPIVRKIRMKSKMSAMRLIQNQRDSFSVNTLCDTANIRNNTVICRRCNDYGPDIRIIIQCMIYLDQYMPPPMPPPAGAAGSGAGISVTTLSVVSRVAATEAAFCKALRVTLVGSMMPLSIISV